MTATRPLTSRDPARLGAHRLLGRLGEGGQGVVYLAEDESGTRVAVKLLHDRGGSRETFLKEVSAARKVASFCTAEILHVGQDDELPYVVTEFIDGPSLRALIEEKGPQNGPALYRLAIGTATALAAIHQAGRPDLGGLTGPLRELVTQALQKDPARRPESRDVLLRLLEHSHGPIAAPEALAQGRALAMAGDESLATPRPSRRSSSRPSAAAGRPPSPSRAA